MATDNKIPYLADPKFGLDKSAESNSSDSTDQFRNLSPNFNFQAQSSDDVGDMTSEFLQGGNETTFEFKGSDMTSEFLDSEPAVSSLSSDIERFSTINKAIDTGNILASYIAKGTFGNIADFPFVIGNMLLDVSEYATGFPKTRSPFPSQNFLGIDTG